MVKANELRIGNLLNYQTAEGDIVTVEVNLALMQWLINDEKGFNLVHSPIILSEEWLVKFGFRKSGNVIWKSLYALKAELHIEIYKNENVITIESDFAKLILEPIKNVHQLQNLYFALTGEELEKKGGGNE